MNFANITSWIIPEGSVTQVTDSLNRVIWQKTQPVPPLANTYFYVEDISGSANTLTIRKQFSGAPTITVYYSTDQQNWSSMGNTDTTGITATIPSNGKLYLKCNTNAWYNSEPNIITATGNYNVGGNIMSLLYGDNFIGETSFPNGSENNFRSLFVSCLTVINANNLILPTNTTKCCYEGMFSSCRNLTTAPALPATTMTNACYEHLFYNCTSLTTAPILPATTLAIICYEGMFNGCTNLNSVTTYAQDISATNCIANWLKNVAATGDFYNLGGATYTSGADGIPTGWTEHNSL